MQKTAPESVYFFVPLRGQRRVLLQGKSCRGANHRDVCHKHLLSACVTTMPCSAYRRGAKQKLKAGFCSELDCPRPTGGCRSSALLMIARTCSHAAQAALEAKRI